MTKSIISDYTVKAVKDLSFLGVLEKEGVEFRKVGREAVTLCPWHNDSNPSLTISDDKGFCFCFVCQTGNDSIGFIQAKCGLSFAEAIEKIAISNEIPVIYENIDPELAAKEAHRKAEILGQLCRQQENFRSLLKDQRAQRIRDFLDERAILPSTSRYFGLGYSNQGFFSDRITIPIHDHIGNLIGFTGRVTREGEKPKYKNTESNEYFDKSRIVFNEHRAAKFIKESGSVVFVEGHFDVISLYQAGIRNVVAMQGTAPPNEAVISRLSRKTKRFILCYDSDEGGKKATENFIKVAGPMACRGDITISVAHLPENTDPDQCVREGIVDFISVIESSSPWLDWQLDVWLASVDRDDTSMFSEIETRIRRLVESIQSPVLRQFYIDKASKALAMDQSSAIQIAKNWSKSLPTIKFNKLWSRPTPFQTRNVVERRLLRLYIHIEGSRDACRPLMERIQSPVYRWAWSRIREIEVHAGGILVKDVLMAILVVAEPHYMRQLRPVVCPSIKVNENSDIMNHIEEVIVQDLTTTEL